MKHGVLRCSLLLLGLTGCGKDAGTSSPAPPSPVPSTTASAPAADPVVDLLHTVMATVAVSSKVANPKDFPEHLVDGKADTAWNGGTGDLNGFIAFRVPAVSRVTRIELTVGFDARRPKGDLFTMNHRITRVRLLREGAALKEIALDPEVRALQGFDVDEAGGDFRLEILATLPGSEKKWRELTVSEFRVWGKAGGAAENPSHLPLMAVGSLDGVRQHAPTALEGPTDAFESVATLCTAWSKIMKPQIDRAYPGDRYPGPIDEPHCHVDDFRPQSPSTFAMGPFLGGTFLDANDPEQEKSRLALQTAAGFTMTNVVLWSRYHDDPGCLHSAYSRVEDARLVTSPSAQPVLLVRILHKDYRWMQVDESQNGATTLELAYACHIDTKGASACDGPLTTGRAARHRCRQDAVDVPQGADPRACWRSTVGPRHHPAPVSAQIDPS